MPLCLNANGREQLAKGRETLASARAAKAIHSLSIMEMITVLGAQTVDYEEDRRQGPELDRSRTFDSWLEDGMKFVRGAIRELTTAASSEIQDLSPEHSLKDKEANVCLGKMTGASPVFNLIYPSETVEIATTPIQVLAPRADISSRKITFIEHQMERLLRTIFCAPADLIPYGLERRMAAKKANMIHEQNTVRIARARNRAKEIKEREREMVNSFKKMHV
ncbi:hypothetical protein V866_003515 [Kwoniella sp. B9012]